MQSDLRIILTFVAVVALVAPAAAVDVYVSNPAEGAIYSITPGTATQVYIEAGTRFENMVVDPEGRLIACDPDAGRISVIEGGVANPVYQWVSGELQRPQCGWFAANGDLFVTDEAAGSGVYRLARDGNGFGAPALVAGSASLGAGFVGGGVTQSARGDLLVADRASGQVWMFEYDLVSGGFYAPMPLITGLSDPTGVARAHRAGMIWVATATGLKTYDRFGSPATNPCPALGKKERPFFLDFAADDTLYVASTSNNSGTLWELDPYAPGGCTANPLFTFLKKNGYAPSAEGTAVGLFTDQVTGIPLHDTDPGSPYLLDPDSQLFLFGDSAWEFLPSNSCEATVTYREASPSEAAGLIPPDTPAKVVIAEGDNGRVRIYDIQPVIEDDCPSESADPTALYRHGVNAYFAYVPNPRVVRCPDGAMSGDQCRITDLSTYFPFNGLLPDDDRVGVRTRDFSEYFSIDVDLADEDNPNGEFCGFEPPVRNPDPADFGSSYDDPNLLNILAYRNALPEFSTTESVAFKFRVAEIVDGAANCDSGPFIDNANILFSIARLRTSDPGSMPLEPFEPVPVFSAGGSGEEDPAIFGDPASPGNYYHYNAKFTGYEAGYYQIVLVPLTDNFAAEVRYFEVVP